MVYCLATSFLYWNIFLKSGQSQRNIPKLQFRSAKNPFTTRNAEKNAKIRSKIRGKNGDIWEYAAPVFL